MISFLWSSELPEDSKDESSQEEEEELEDVRENWEGEGGRGELEAGESMLSRSCWKSSSSLFSKTSKSDKARESGEERGEGGVRARRIVGSACSGSGAHQLRPMSQSSPSPTCTASSFIGRGDCGAVAVGCVGGGGLLLIWILSFDIVMPIDVTPCWEATWPALGTGCTSSKLIGRPRSTVVTCGLLEQDITTGNGLGVWPVSCELIGAETTAPDDDDMVEVEDFLGGMMGLLGGTGGGMPLPTLTVFFGVVGWAPTTVAGAAGVAEGRVALVVTWNVTLPSLLVVVKTFVPAEAETATRGDDEGPRPL